MTDATGWLVRGVATALIIALSEEDRVGWQEPRFPSRCEPHPVSQAFGGGGVRGRMQATGKTMVMHMHILYA